MNRDTFNRIYGHSSIAESEMDRKYRVFIREREEMQLMEQANRMQAMQAATAPAPGTGDNSVNEYVVYDYVEDYVE